MFYGHLSNIVCGSHCIPVEHSKRTFKIFKSEISYYYEEDTGNVSISCISSRGTCRVEGQKIILSVRNDSLNFSNLTFSIGIGTFDYLNDSININHPIQSTYKFSHSYDRVKKDGTLKYVIWGTENCIKFREHGELEGEIWTTQNKIQFISIKNGSESYLLQFQDAIQFNKTCLTNISRKDGINDDVSPTNTKYGVGHISQNNVSQSSNIFCQTQIDNSSTYVFLIILLTFFLVVISVISILVVLKYVRTCKKNRALNEYLEIVTLKLENIYKEEDGNNYDEIRKVQHENTTNFNSDEMMMENSLYSS